MILFGSCLYKPEDEAGDIDLAIDIEGLYARTLYYFTGRLLMSDELNKLVDVINLSYDIPIIKIILDEGAPIYEEKG